MSRITRYVVALAAIVAAAVFAIHRARNRSTAMAVPPLGYTADMSCTDLKDPAKSFTGKMYIRWGRGISGIRTEYVYPDHRRILLNLTSSNETWMLDPEHRTYWLLKTRHVLKLHSIPRGGPRLIEVPEKGSFRSLGTKTIAGRKTQGFEITELGPNSKLTWTAWEDDTLGTVLLIDKPGIVHSEITRVDETAPPEDLFRVPVGYTKVDAPAS
jgi:hypothetical protein